jgi:hypothetical protein
MDLIARFTNLLIIMEGQPIEEQAACLARVVEAERPAPVAPCEGVPSQFMQPRRVH